jgi:hypothetical protein
MGIEPTARFSFTKTPGWFIHERLLAGTLVARSEVASNFGIKERSKGGI